MYPGFGNICPNGLRLGFLVPTPMACWVHANVSQNATSLCARAMGLRPELGSAIGHALKSQTQSACLDQNPTPGHPSSTHGEIQGGPAWPNIAPDVGVAEAAEAPPYSGWNLRYLSSRL